MPRISRWLVALAALAVLGVFVFPLWRVTLEAPQYPEGIGMLIHVNGVTGVNEHDLDNINGLNHYIGMHRIEPDAIPELRVMPWIAGAIVLTGLLVAWRGTRGVYIGWATVVLSTLAVGVYDFWKWEYDYGHNLNPDAAIRIPGLTYQPPLFGSKQILNFVANSYPDTGGWMLIVAGAVFGLVLLHVLLARRPGAPAAAPRRPTLVTTAAMVVTSLLLMSCTRPGPRPLVTGTDECAQCRMMITDPRFGGEVITRTGKVQVFDAIECLAGYVSASDSATVREVWVSDFEHPGTWLPAATARFVRGATIGSPMGRSLLALAPSVPADVAVQRYGGQASDWAAIVRASTTGDSATPAGHAHAH
ncbi:MAG: nitrous oxide reductase accessory protein NosL [Gemmatimonadaceae bacterium]|nr:nitrous oxide reductase accessory protein NosL [Gemmatimonadaceae bacterium]